MNFMSLITPIAEQLRSLPPEVATMLIAMIPIGELRAAIPLGVTLYKLPIFSSLIWSIIGNMIPVYFILIAFEKVSQFLRAHSTHADKFFTWLFERTRKKLENNIVRYGAFALALFVAVPLPVTGAWTGTLAAFVFGINKKKAFFAILLGVIAAGIIVSTLTFGGQALFRAL